MQWYAIAVSRLRDYEARAAATQSIPEQIALLETRQASIRSSRTDKTPVKGGGNMREEALISNIMLRDELEKNLEIAQREIAITGAALDVLTQEERRILELFYIRRRPGYIEQLCDEMSVEKSRLYEMKNEALRKFALASCGTVDL